MPRSPTSHQLLDTELVADHGDDLGERTGSVVPANTRTATGRPAGS